MNWGHRAAPPTSSRWREARGDGSDVEMAALMNIHRAIDSSITLRNKRDLILAFVDPVNVGSDTDEEWRQFVEAKKRAELDELIDAEGLKPDETRAFVADAFRDGSIPEHRNRRHQDPAAGLTVRRRQQPRRQEAGGARQACGLLRPLCRAGVN